MVLRMFMASRPQFLTASVMPVLVTGAYIKWRDGIVILDLWLLTLAGLVLLHAAANLLNDYFDHLSMADDINQQFVAPFSGGARFIQRGLVSPHQVLFAALICLAAGSGIGLFLAATRGWPILVLGLVGVVTLFFYTAPPLQLGYRGLGELIIALDFGILPMLGTEYVLLERCSESTLLLSVPVACMIAAVLGINEFPDADPDALVGKRHLVVILGRATAARLLSWMYALAFGIIAAMVATLWLPAGALCSFVAAIPAGLAAQRLITRPNDSLSWQQACPAGVAAHFSFGLLLFLSLILAAPIPRG